MKRYALVTGGARGIGLAITRQLLKEGVGVSILGTSPQEKVAPVLRDLRTGQSPVLYFSGSLADRGDRERYVAGSVEAFGRIDSLINNAGVAPKVRTDLLSMTEESFTQVLDINLKGMLFLTQAVARRMVGQEPAEGRRGVIVNVSSMSAYVSSVSRGEYCISKAGVSMVTALFADRLAEEGIGVFEVRPGIIATDMTAAVTEKYDRFFAESGQVPIARWGTPEDVAGAVSLLISDKLRYSTGDVLNVDGGYHIRRL